MTATHKNSKWQRYTKTPNDTLTQMVQMTNRKYQCHPYKEIKWYSYTGDLNDTLTQNIQITSFIRKPKWPSQLGEPNDFHTQNILTSNIHEMQHTHIPEIFRLSYLQRGLLNGTFLPSRDRRVGITVHGHGGVAVVGCTVGSLSGHGLYAKGSLHATLHRLVRAGWEQWSPVGQRNVLVNITHILYILSCDTQCPVLWHTVSHPVTCPVLCDTSVSHNVMSHIWSVYTHMK